MQIVNPLAAAETRPVYASIATTETITGLKRRSIYNHLKTGNLVARKCGRSTLIDIDHALAFIRGLPPYRA